MRVKHARLATLDATAVHQHHGNEINTITVRAFGRGATDTLSRIDAELVCFDVPAIRRRAEGAGAKFADTQDEIAPVVSVDTSGVTGSNQRSMPPCSAL